MNTPAPENAEPAAEAGDVSQLPAPSFIPKQGDRAFIVGQTGSGKTEFAVWLLERLPNSPVIIYDTKGEAKFEALPRSTLVRSQAALTAALDQPEFDYIVFRVPPEVIADNDAMDDLLWTHFHEYRGVDLFIDEVFSFSQNGRSGKGLTAMLTQGRSHKFTCIMAAQKPVWLSRFIISEAQHYFLFFLVDRKDRIRMADVVPNFDDYPLPPEYQFYYYAPRMAEPRLMARVLLDKPAEKPYKPLDEPTTQGVPDSGTRLNWI